MHLLSRGRVSCASCQRGTWVKDPHFHQRLHDAGGACLQISLKYHQKVCGHPRCRSLKVRCFAMMHPLGWGTGFPPFLPRGMEVPVPHIPQHPWDTGGACFTSLGCSQQIWDIHQVHVEKCQCRSLKNDQ
jgi:hypothetical protein